MDNTMDINNESNNSMDTLSFFWMALFNDGKYINQFEGEEEHRFKEVIDKNKDLKILILHSKKTHDKFTLDISTGTIYFNKKEIYFNKEIKNNIRPIFFEGTSFLRRRHRHEIGTYDLKEKNHKIEYHLGFQYNDKLGNNRQVVLIIDSESNYVITGE